MTTPTSDVLRLENVAKNFTMHLRGGVVLSVVRDVTLVVRRGECVVLGGPSGAGKSSILKMIFGNYRVDAGRILVRSQDAWTDVATASPRCILALRRGTLGYVSQFLRTIPRVAVIDIVTNAAFQGSGAAPDTAEGVERSSDERLGYARQRAEMLLERLNLPKRLWHLPPATFSGGEQQRVNIACGFAANHSILLLDEPTASLDAENRAAVVDLVHESRSRGVAILGIFHDEDVRRRVANRVVDVTQFQARG
jgi:alpha-D-ribose 1-methylphosphonate 5-triphosphate synthase subunit PhnL